jgi:hypothetical protein
MRRFALTILSGLIALSSSPAEVLAQATTGVVRVAKTGSDSANCGSLASPCASLQFAVDEFASEMDGRILVAVGTYTSTDPRHVMRVTQGRNLIVEGGYTTAFAAADPDVNSVVIDGQDLRRCVTVDPTPGMRDSQLTLTGLELTRGLAPQELAVNTLSSFGGALDAFQATVALIGVDITQSRALGVDAASGLPGDGSGGGVSLRNATGLLSDVEFIGNRAEGGDGSGTAFRGGLGVGGGLSVFQSAVTLNDVRASDNVAKAGDAPSALGVVDGQRADALGGFWALILSRASASRVVAHGNQAIGGEAATFAGLGIGGAMMMEQSGGTVTVRDAILYDNEAIGGVGTVSTGGLGGGGAIFASDTPLSLHGSQLITNRAEGGSGPVQGGDGAGAGIYMDSVNAVPGGIRSSNTILAGNVVVAGAGATPGISFGGGIFLQCPQGPGLCDPLLAQNNAELTHVTLADNVVMGATFNQGAAVYASPGVSVDASFGIVSGHTTPIIDFDRGEAVIAFADVTFNDTLWDGNSRKAFAVPPDGVFQDNDPRSGDPDYVDPLSSPADYHIGAASAALEEAIGSVTEEDLDRELRPTGPGIRDLGADEFHPTPTPRVFGVGLYAGIHEDGRLMVVDPTTGRATDLGSGPIDLSGLGSHAGRLFALWGEGQLVELEPASGAALRIAQRGIGVGGEGGLTVDADGTGYAAEGTPNADQLWTFTPSGPVPSLVGAQGIGFDGVASDPSGDLFGLSESLQLYSLDRNGAGPTLLGSSGLTPVGTAGLAYSESGTLFAAVSDTLYTLDPADGSPAIIGALGAGPFTMGGPSGLTFVPEPAGQACAIAATIALALIRRARDRRTLEPN